MIMSQWPLNQFLEDLRKIAAYDFANLPQFLEEGHINNVRFAITRAHALFAAAAELDFESVPANKMSETENQCEEFIKLVKQIMRADPKIGSTSQIVNQLTGTLVTKYDNEWFPHLSLILAFLEAKGERAKNLTKLLASGDALRQGLEESLTSFQDSGASTLRELESKLTEADSVLSKLKLAAGETGVALYAKTFLKEAQGHQSTAYGWLGVTALTALVLIVVTIQLMTLHRNDLQMIVGLPPNTQLAIYVGPRLFVVVVGFFALRFGTQNYRASWHNFIVNKHRQLALDTFETFVAATQDPATKQAVLLEATKTIFSATQTGFIPNESDADSTAKVIEKWLPAAGKS